MHVQLDSIPWLISEYSTFLCKKKKKKPWMSFEVCPVLINLCDLFSLFLLCSIVYKNRHWQESQPLRSFAGIPASVCLLLCLMFLSWCMCTKYVLIPKADFPFLFLIKILPTCILNEICSINRYVTGHIWACPPSEGDDYIFHCHPPDQKIPKPKRLQEWYRKMLDKAFAERIIHDYKVNWWNSTTIWHWNSTNDWAHF